MPIYGLYLARLGESLLGLQRPEVVRRFRDNSAAMDTDGIDLPIADLENDFDKKNPKDFSLMKRANIETFRILKRLMDRRSMGTDRMNHLIRFSKRNSYQ